MSDRDETHKPRLARQIVVRIQRMIVEGHYPAGAELPAQRELAEMLGVSRPSLREAISTLQTLGFLKVEHGRRTIVQDPRSGGGGGATWRFGARAGIAEIYQLRHLLEGDAARRAARATDAAFAAALAENLARMRAAVVARDLLVTSELDEAFHALVFERAENRAYLEVHAALSEEIAESQRLPFANQETAWDELAEHEKIVRALSLGDPDGAAYYMQYHIERAARRAGVVDPL